jgi:hypothetical protein
MTALVIPPLTLVDDTGAIVGLLLTHVPPSTLSLKVVVDPRHATVVPDIGLGNCVTVTTLSELQPETV